jgi:hypothetical protein
MSIQETELTMLDGTVASFSQFSGKVVLVVNVASRCGLAPQYEALEALQKKYGSRGFTVLGMPSNQFLQELKKSEDIAEYCSHPATSLFPSPPSSLRLPVKVTVALAIIGELAAGYVVRDNLTLNVIMLAFPVEAIAEWQAAGGAA